MRLYKDFEPAPLFRSAEGAFTVEMWNRNEWKAAEAGPSDPARVVQAGDASSAAERVYAFVREKGEASRKEVQEEFRVGSTKAYKLLKLLCAEGRLIQNQNGNKTTYSAPSPGQYNGSSL